MEQEKPVSENENESAITSLSVISIPAETGPAEGRIISCEESFISGHLKDIAVASMMKNNDIHEVSSREKEEKRSSACIRVERNNLLRNDTLGSPNCIQTGIKLHMDHSRLTSTVSSELRPENSPHEELHQSPRTERSVYQTKRYIKDELADSPVDERAPNARPTREPAESLNRKRHDAKDPRTGQPMEHGSSIPQGLTNLPIASKFPGHRRRRRAKTRKKRATKRRRAAKLRKEKEATERTHVPAEETALKETRAEDKRLKRVCRRIPMGELIQPLDAKWEQCVYNAMATPGMLEVLATTSNGCKLTRRDLGTLKVVKGRDPPRGWLNDEVISACLQHVVDYGLRKSNHKIGETPKYHAFNTFFYKNLREKGIQSIRSWATRAKIGKENLLSVERLFIPVHSGRHWSLIVVSPIGHTIEYFDSLGGPAHPYILNMAVWLRAELGKLFKEDEWTVPTGSLGAGPQQSNDSDCGVFTCTNARMVLLGLDPMEYEGSDSEIQRTRMVAELLNGGLKGDFEPLESFDSASPQSDGNDGQYLLASINKAGHLTLVK